MPTLLLGTKNAGKIREIRALLADLQLELLTWQECPFPEIAEDGLSCQENALKKARQISAKTGLAVLADDAGLEVAALGGAPGVLSARYSGAPAGEERDEQNIAKLLQNLAGVTDRLARFVCVMVLHWPEGRELIATGELRGRIAERPRGQNGFGYDPVFIPENYRRTLGELGPAVKNSISHRRRALEQLKAALKSGAQLRPG